jgi:pyruvate ferredoxin oxidoreductase gamma subunit
MFRVRLHGRGGQGVQTAARVLGSAFFAEGFEVQDAPRYGAERRGAPIFATVRASRAPIRERGLVTRADLVAVADPTLIGVRAAGVLDGIDDHTWLLIASDVDADTWAKRLGRAGRVATLPAEPDAGERSFAAAACAGGAARLLGVLSRESLERALESELAALGPAALAQTRTRALAAWESLAKLAGRVEEGRDVESSAAPPAWVDIPLDPGDTAAPDVRTPLSAAQVRTGLWRTQRPVIDDALCRRCSWVCSTFCPDGAIEVLADGRPRIDYDHCKGCLVCAAVCPPHAIRIEREVESPDSPGASQ